MELSPIYLEKLENATKQGIEQGIQQVIEEGIEQGKQGERRIVIASLLRIRFGSIDEQISRIIEPLTALSPEEFTPLLLQSSREDLLARF